MDRARLAESVSTKMLPSIQTAEMLPRIQTTHASASGECLSTGMAESRTAVVEGRPRDGVLDRVLMDAVKSGRPRRPDRPGPMPSRQTACLTGRT